MRPAASIFMYIFLQPASTVKKASTNWTIPPLHFRVVCSIVLCLAGLFELPLQFRRWSSSSWFELQCFSLLRCGNVCTCLSLSDVCFYCTVSTFTHICIQFHSCSLLVTIAEMRRMRGATVSHSFLLSTVKQNLKIMQVQNAISLFTRWWQNHCVASSDCATHSGYILVAVNKNQKVDAEGCHFQEKWKLQYFDTKNKTVAFT